MTCRHCVGHVQHLSLQVLVAICLRARCYAVQKLVLYEPEVYPGLVYQSELLQRDQIVAMVYPRGQVVVSRCQSIEHVKNACEVLQGLLKPYLLK